MATAMTPSLKSSLNGRYSNSYGNWNMILSIIGFLGFLGARSHAHVTHKSLYVLQIHITHHY